MIPGLTLLALTWTVALEPQREPRDEAVDKALTFLKRAQERNGSWQSPTRQKNPALTALSVMAFLSAGNTPEKGPHAEAVAKGIRYVLDQQLDSGLIAAEGGLEMYQHGICTLMLAQALPVAEGDLAKEIQGKLDKAVALILKAQRSEGNHEGGWRYRVSGVDGDLSVTGWQIQALRAAKKAGRDVPDKAIEAAINYVRKAREPRTGAFRYFPDSRITVPMTAVGIIALHDSKGEEQQKEAVQAGAFLLAERNAPRWGNQHCHYELYYASKALHGLGGNYWKTYRPLLHKVLLDNQSESGSWQGTDPSSRIYGANFCTAMAVLAMTVDGYKPPEKKD
jgi:uncharacterized protein YfaS (alpha-2-macroglobulin family)